MRRRMVAALLPLALLVSAPLALQGKKVKNSFKIEKEKTPKSDSGKQSDGVEVMMEEGSEQDLRFTNLLPQLKKCSFSGFDKELSSNLESFILSNATDSVITGFQVKVDYLDMQNRMFHSRTITESCHVPPHESRRIDIPAWDKQHTYYYYLGNKPRKVATPFKVVFKPISFRIRQ